MRGGSQRLSAGRQAHRTAQLHQVLRYHPSDAVPDKKSDLVTYTPLDRQPVQFIADGRRYSAELGNVQNQLVYRFYHFVSFVNIRRRLKWEVKTRMV